MFSQNTQATEQWLTESLSSFGKGTLFAGVPNNFSAGAISSYQRSGSEILPSYQSYYTPTQLPAPGCPGLKTTFAATSFSTPLCQAFPTKTVGTKQEPNLAPPPLMYNAYNNAAVPTTQHYTLHETPQRHYVRHQYAPVPETWSPPQEQYAEVPESKKRKRVVTAPPRKVRPKVVESKGATQCVGMNLKKGVRCRNAALMEYFGPRPIYCAEHIEQDPRSIYVKCKSSYQKVPGDAKGCKEVVLKEFSVCHKHFEDKIKTIPLNERQAVLDQYLTRVEAILTALETEAAQAKKERHDLYQRKNKLIPKFQNMKETLQKYLNDAQTMPQQQQSSKFVLASYEMPAPFQDNSNPSLPPSLLDNFCTLDEEWKSLLAGGLC